MIGIYVGWRGLSIKVWGIKELSYWDRKAVAEQVGKGGVTELLLRLEQIVIDDKRPNRNLFLVTGHSFGGAIVLSGLNEVLLERVVNAQPPPESGGECLVTRPFGHGVVLLNPAIEANEALQLKEHVIEVASKTRFCKQQDRLMHVISSRADRATEVFFVLGQSLGVNPTWEQTELRRRLGCEDWKFEESDLDTTTVGNFIPFQTGELLPPGDSESTDPEWGYRSFVADDQSCNSDPTKPDERLLVTHNEPLAFIRTDKQFIGDHNDVFNPAVASYLAAIVAEARYKRTLGRAVDGADDLPKRCRGEEPDFNFGSCFKAYQAKFKEAWPR